MRMGRWIISTLVVVSLAIPGWAQFGPRTPQMSGIWHPVVGAGAAYQVTDHDGSKKEMEIAVVGQEKVDGQDAYWIEMSFQDPHGGPGAMKTLTVMGGPNPGAKKVIMQMNGQAFEMPINNPRMSGQAKSAGTDLSKGGGQVVGTETITTPAGTFECEHYRANDPPSDVWISAKVSPWGMVKSQSKDSNMLLIRVITEAKTKITGPVQQFDPMKMMQQGQQRP
ncbi:MAG TPA: hypothetical protein VJW51_12945 [Candidatus Acidoferrales bacterium]|nr:hypothetical protein [Candidatus Acidoferrales bacterium]